jgi:hypothetical protein
VTPDEVVATLRLIARQAAEIDRLRAALADSARRVAELEGGAV